MPNENVAPFAPLSAPPAARADQGAAAVGVLASIGAIFSALACCLLPLALAGLGVGASLSIGLSPLVPLHWPLSIGSTIAVAAGWALYLRRRKMACAPDTECAVTPPARATRVMLSAATVLVLLSSFWSYIEPMLMRLLGPS